MENDRRPRLRVAVQRADKDAMFLQARNVRHGGRVYVQRRNGDRGIRYEYLCAIGKDENIVAQLAWESQLNFSTDKFSKDIFADVDPEEVSYLLWITFHGWYKPSTAEQEAQDVYFSDTMTGAELTAIVYLKPKDMGWSELVRTASDEKFEQEGAYKYPPKDMPELPGIHQALRDGCRLHAFMSGGGLRVIRLEKRKQLKAYGEFPHVEEALQHADEDYLAGGLPYDQKYGSKGKYVHYLTGSTLPTSNLDAWIRAGQTFDCMRVGKQVIFRLDGYIQYEMPAAIEEWTVANPGEPIQWSSLRGFTYDSVYVLRLFANGEAGHSMKTVSVREGKEGHDAFFYEASKTGRGSTFWEAMTAAFAAPDMEK